MSQMLSPRARAAAAAAHHVDRALQGRSVRPVPSPPHSPSRRGPMPFAVPHMLPASMLLLSSSGTTTSTPSPSTATAATAVLNSPQGLFGPPPVNVQKRPPLEAFDPRAPKRPRHAGLVQHPHVPGSDGAPPTHVAPAFMPAAIPAESVPGFDGVCPAPLAGGVTPSHVATESPPAAAAQSPSTQGTLPAEAFEFDPTPPSSTNQVVLPPIIPSTYGDSSPVTSLTGSGKRCSNSKCKNKKVELPMSHFVKYHEPFLAAQCFACRQQENAKSTNRRKTKAAAEAPPADSNGATNAHPNGASNVEDEDASSTVPIFAEYCPTLSDLVLEVARHVALEPSSRGVPNFLLFLPVAPITRQGIVHATSRASVAEVIDEDAPTTDVWAIDTFINAFNSMSLDDQDLNPITNELDGADAPHSSGPAASPTPNLSPDRILDMVNIVMGCVLNALDGDSYQWNTKQWATQSEPRARRSCANPSCPGAVEISHVTKPATINWIRNSPHATDDDLRDGIICVRYSHPHVHQHRTRPAISSELQQLVIDNCHRTFPDVLVLAHAVFEDEMVAVGTARLRTLFDKARGGQAFRGLNSVAHIRTLLSTDDNCRKYLGRLLVCQDGGDARQYIGFTTKVGEELMETCPTTTTELLIMDGTFKTNVDGFELLALMGMAHQRAYPLAYMLLAAGQVRPGDRMDAIAQFLREFAEAFPATPPPEDPAPAKFSLVDPLFCLTDKDLGQIGAYQSAFPDSIVQLCQFHVLKAIRTRILAGSGNDAQKISVKSLRETDESVKATMGSAFPTLWALAGWDTAAAAPELAASSQPAPGPTVSASNLSSSTTPQIPAPHGPAHDAPALSTLPAQPATPAVAPASTVRLDLTPATAPTVPLDLAPTTSQPTALARMTLGSTRSAADHGQLSKGEKTQLKANEKRLKAEEKRRAKEEEKRLKIEEKRRAKEEERRLKELEKRKAKEDKARARQEAIDRKAEEKRLRDEQARQQRAVDKQEEAQMIHFRGDKNVAMTKITDLVRKHGREHASNPRFDGNMSVVLDAEALYRTHVEEAYDLCKSLDHAPIWVYLWSNWYCPEEYTRWAVNRAEISEIPYVLTTNANEAHWSQFKHRLARRGRVSVGILVAFIAAEVIPGLLVDMRRSGSDSSTPRWRQEFNREFRKHAIKPFDSTSITKYATDVKRWHCACPGYCMGRFRMCKHLVLLLARHRTSSSWDIADLRIAPRLTAPFVAIEYLHNGDLLRDAVRPHRTRVLQQPQLQKQTADAPPMDSLQQSEDERVEGPDALPSQQTEVARAALLARDLHCLVAYLRSILLRHKGNGVSFKELESVHLQCSKMIDTARYVQGKIRANIPVTTNGNHGNRLTFSSTS